MISGAYTSSEKAGRLFFKRTAVFFWKDSEWGAGLFARAPECKPVYFSMICSDSSSRRRLICHVVSARHPARDVQREIPHKPNTLLSPVFGICSRFGSNPAHQAAGSYAPHQLILLNEAVEHGGDLSAGRLVLRVKQSAGFSLYKVAADRPLHGRW